MTTVPCGTAALITAITNANAHRGGVLNLARSCTYALTAVDNQDANGSSNGLPQITSPITVNGNNATISRADDVADPFRFFDVPSTAGRLVLHRLTMSGGIDDTQQPGGGPGNAVLVHDGGRLLTNATTFTANGVPQVGSGRGAVGSDGGNVTLVDSTFEHNFGLIGAGVYNTNGTMRLVRTRFLDNAAPSVIGNGGAVANDDNGTLVMVASTLSGNRAGIFGGGVWNTGSMSVLASRITGGDVGYPGSPFVVPGEGGGIANFGTMTVTATRIVANHSSLDIGTAQGTAAGIKNFRDAVITLVNSPVTDNIAVAAPGGIDNDNGTVRLRHSPVTRNEPTNCTGSISPVPGCVG
ncbi:MAG: hypothetical protein WCA46_03255 [Actinocatenispora sp.]